MQIAGHADRHHPVVDPVGDQDCTAGQATDVDAGGRVERLDPLQQIARTLRIAITAILPEGLLNFRTRKESVGHRRPSRASRPRSKSPIR